MVIIPPQLQALRPTKPPTLAEMQAAKRPRVTVRELTEAERQSLMKEAEAKATEEFEAGKPTRASEQKAELQKKIDYYRNLANVQFKRGTERGEVRGEEHMETVWAYEAAMKYATGEYTTASVMEYASEKEFVGTKKLEAAREAKLIEPKMVVRRTEIPREVHTPTGVYYEYRSGRREFVRPGGMVVEAQRQLVKTPKEIIVPAAPPLREISIPRDLIRPTETGTAMDFFIPPELARRRRERELIEAYEYRKALPFFQKYPQLAKAKEGEKFSVPGLLSEILLYSGEFLVEPYEKRILSFAPEIVAPTPEASALAYIPGYLLLFAFFEPAMSSAMAKKSRQKLKTVQKKKVKLTKKEASELLDDYVKSIREKWIRGDKAPVREAYRKALQTRNSKLIKQSEDLIRESLGKTEAEILFKDLKAQELPFQPVSPLVPGFIGKEPTKLTGLPYIETFGVSPRLPAVFAAEEAKRVKEKSFLDFFGLVRPEEKPEIKPKVKEKVFEGFRVAPSLKAPVKPKEKEIQRPVSLIAPGLVQPTRLVQPTAPKLFQPSILVQPSALAQPSALKQPEKFKWPTPTVSGVPGVSRPPKVPKIKVPPPPLIPFWFPGERPFVKEKRFGYHGFVLQEGTKPRKSKWVQVTDTPHTFEGAKSRSARVVDETISARGKVEQITEEKVVRGKLKKVAKVFTNILPQGDNYFNLFQHKFREHKIVKGKKVPMKAGSFIELRKHRLDTRGEVQKIHYEKKRAEINPVFSFNTLSRRKRKRRSK